MSTYNTSEEHSEWIVSPVIDGRTGSMSLDDVANGTSIAIDTYVNDGVGDRTLVPRKISKAG